MVPSIDKECNSHNNYGNFFYNWDTHFSFYSLLMEYMGDNHCVFLCWHSRNRNIYSRVYIDDRKHKTSHRNIFLGIYFSIWGIFTVLISIMYYFSVPWRLTIALSLFTLFIQIFLMVIYKNLHIFF